MATTPAEPLAPLRSDPGGAGILLDFDGTLSEIVAHPDLAQPVTGAREAVAALVPRFALVALVSGRPSDEVAARLGVEGVRAVGGYGLGGPGLPDDVRTAVHDAVKGLEGVWAEDKGTSIAVHFRAAPERADDVRGALEHAVVGTGTEIISGKMVWEAVPHGAPRKGGAVAELLAGLRAALYAGDDDADLDAFAALDAWDGFGVRVAVRGPETPQALIDAADLVAEGPEGLVALLRQLV